ncbi:hypothetical protein ES707_18896 [subsurface metagenome]
MIDILHHAACHDQQVQDQRGPFEGVKVAPVSIDDVFIEQYVEFLLAARVLAEPIACPLVECIRRRGIRGFLRRCRRSLGKLGAKERMHPGLRRGVERGVAVPEHGDAGQPSHGLDQCRLDSLAAPPGRISEGHQQHGECRPGDAVHQLDLGPGGHHHPDQRKCRCRGDDGGNQAREQRVSVELRHPRPRHWD